ncbi:MAG: phosphoenolpyruvate synthase, partial [Gemmatimonadales bacterium]|nr:phosphoenolpyruvate synthase [Gemmatimonadales bacterium]
MPMDIEWTLAKKEFAIVQARPITALPEPELPPPTEWRLPQGAYIAMRNNIVELMADPLSPLFGTLGLDSVNASIGRQMTGFMGRPGLTPEQLIITVNGYAYYNGSMTLGQIAQIFLGSIGILKRMFTGAVERWVDVGRPRYVATVQRWQAKRWREFSTTEILSAVRELAEAAIDAYGALVSGVIPAAWISEALFTIFYDTLVKRRGDPAAPTYLMGFNSMPIRAEKSLYDLAEWSRTRAGLATYLSNTPASQLAAQFEDGQMPPDVNADDWHEWQ